MTKIILASASRHRATLLSNAGISFEQQASRLDERALEAPLENTDILPSERAAILAEAKSLDVSENQADSLVIGCDQILALDTLVLHKAKDMEEARARLLLLSGKTHTLHNGITIAQNGRILWRHESPCFMTMRDLSPQFIGRYLAQAGEEVLSSVGVYQIEGLGSQLFEKVDGDFFSIIGLPLLPLLDQLRNLDAIDG